MSKNSWILNDVDRQDFNKPMELNKENEANKKAIRDLLAIITLYEKIAENRELTPKEKNEFDKLREKIETLRELMEFEKFGKDIGDNKER